jgi:hypothetical protein
MRVLWRAIRIVAELNLLLGSWLVVTSVLDLAFVATGVLRAGDTLPMHEVPPMAVACVLVAQGAAIAVAALVVRRWVRGKLRAAKASDPAG